MFVIEIVILAYFLYVVTYSLFFSIGGLLYKAPKINTATIELKKFGVLIPGYKEDAIIVNSVIENLKIQYPKDFFDLVVIADSFKKETLQELAKLPIIIQEVSFEKSTKVKALGFTIERLPDHYDYIVVLDADNIMEVDYLTKVNAFLNSNPSQATQTQRWPKNKNNDLAVLDGISESINNHIYRQGAFSTGFSVSLSGSGMIFERNIFQSLITNMESIGGFDRELEFNLLEKGIKVKYFREAMVFDQKTDDLGNFNKQRTRWISSQYVYLLKYFKKGTVALFKGDVVYFHSTVWRNIQLPRLINLGLLTIITLLSIPFDQFLRYPYIIWIGLWLINAFSMCISIPRNLYNRKLVLAIFKLPKLFFTMLLLLFKLKGANKKFIHTEHKVV